MKMPYVNKTDDGSIMIEFIKEDMRFNICLEKDLKESSWNFVGKTGEHLHMECDSLPEKMIKYMKMFFEEGEDTE
jgi:hypothetical protein